MALLSGLSLQELALFGEASLAAFRGNPIPAGWTVVTPAALGIAASYRDGNYFTNNGASAIVLRQGNDFIVSFRGTDGSNDVQQYPELYSGTYINKFQPLLSAVQHYAPAGSDFSFTGASLGGGATNLMANIADTKYGGVFGNATFVAFASPNISNANGILNIGMSNDPVYKAINNYGNFASSLDNLVLATSEYMAGNYDGRHPFDDYAHSAGSLARDGLARLQQSPLTSIMSPDSVVIFDAFSGLVQDINPGRQNTGVFYLGQAVADRITGRNGADRIDGLAGNDTLDGGAGSDFIVGAAGNDIMIGGAGNDVLRGGLGKDTMTGGLGVDNFDFNFVTETGKTAATRDVVKDFVHLTDDIDLATIDANGTAAGNTAFVFVAAQGQTFTGVKGQLRWHQENLAGTASDKTIIQGDIDGNKVADFQIELTGLKTLTAADFLL